MHDAKNVIKQSALASSHSATRIITKSNCRVAKPLLISCEPRKYRPILQSFHFLDSWKTIGRVFEVMS